MAAADQSTTEGRRYRGQGPAARRAERRERLLDAGLELMATRGYKGTTVEAIYSHAHLAPRYEREADRLAAAGEIPARDFAITAMVLVGGTSEMVLEWLAHEPREPIESVIDELTEVYVAALSGPRPV